MRFDLTRFYSILLPKSFLGSFLCRKAFLVPLSSCSKSSSVPTSSCSKASLLHPPTVARQLAQMLPWFLHPQSQFQICVRSSPIDKHHLYFVCLSTHYNSERGYRGSMCMIFIQKLQNFSYKHYSVSINCPTSLINICTWTSMNNIVFFSFLTLCISCIIHQE